MRPTPYLFGTACLLAAVAAAPRATQSAQTPNAAQPDSLRFIAHPDHVPAGFPSRDKPLQLANPLAGNANARKVGAQLYVAYNCIDCHGADGSGAMGPSLADGRWHFGGTAGELFESIYQGRPDGMPAWGGRIANDQIWSLITYISSLSEGKNVATENFTGATVQRTGH
jgi:cytochrome c oxidase cbb3-type subunit 3